MWGMSEIVLPTPEDIVARLAKMNMSEAAMCRRADIAPETWQRWKQGRGIPTIRIVQQIVDVINNGSAE